MLDRLRWPLENFVYWAQEHTVTVLFFVVVGLFLYAAIVGLDLLRRIASALEGERK